VRREREAALAQKEARLVEIAVAQERTERLQRRVQRALAGIAALVVVGISAVLWQQSRLNEQRIALDEQRTAGQIQQKELDKRSRDNLAILNSLTQAADQGDAQARQIIGYLYYNGYGVPQNLSQAAKWYLKAAEQGLAVGESSIGWLYQQGWGVPRNYAESLRWNSRAADQGDANGQMNLGRLYLQGFGVPKDVARARQLIGLAAAQGNSEAKELLSRLGQ
jgi:hypothetical protein